jgi:hypothetical protein
LNSFFFGGGGGLFYNAVSIKNIHVALDDRIIDELKRIWKEVVMAQSRYYPAFAWKNCRKPRKPSVRKASVWAEI